MKKIKLILLILISTSVYFIYQKTENTNLKILSLGDGLSLGINSYGIQEYSYVDYYGSYLRKKNKEIHIIKNYSKRDQMIKDLIEQIKNNPNLKRDLMESHILFLTIGYNDLQYQLSIKESTTNNSFNQILKEIIASYGELFQEIRKYYKEKITVIGYYPSNKEETYINLGIQRINYYLKQEEQIEYIDTYTLLSRNALYFSNPSSYYPNRLGYQVIAEEIIQKTLEKDKII